MHIRGHHHNNTTVTKQTSKTDDTLIQQCWNFMRGICCSKISGTLNQNIGSNKTSTSAHLTDIRLWLLPANVYEEPLAKMMRYTSTYLTCIRLWLLPAIVYELPLAKTMGYTFCRLSGCLCISLTEIDCRKCGVVHLHLKSGSIFICYGCFSSTDKD